jgi:uncharacterized RDD family membrane protein YckC
LVLMMEEPAGWYRDPAPANRGEPTTVRYWDGQAWTTQVKPASRAQRQAWQAEDVATYHARAAEQAELGYGEVATRLRHDVVLEASRDVAPDGQPLAGWWARVGAYLLDGLLLTVLEIVCGWRFLSGIVDGFRGVAQQAVDAARAGVQPPSSDQLGSQLVSAVWPAVLGFLAVCLVVRFLYGAGFLKAFQATPGQMALGLQVRLRARPGVLPWSTVLARWFTQNLGTFVAFVPLVGMLAWVYSVLDDLWPLWDGKRQALHDKAARTNVVRVRG